MKKLEKIVQIIVNVFLVFSLVVIVFCIAGFMQLKVLKKPYVDIFGYTLFSVATGSMQPTLNINDIIIVKITDDVKVGDIITYSEENEFITHRVISNNKETFVTKGDYNNTEDNPIDTSKIVGKLVCKIPSFGLLGDILLTPKVFVSVFITLFLFSLCFSYVPSEVKNSKSKKINLFRKINVKDDDNLEVKIVQEGRNNNKDIENLISNIQLDKQTKKEIDLGETAELFLNLKSLEEEEKVIKNKLEEKKRRSSLVDNLNNKTVEEVKSKTKKKIDLDATCEYVFAFNQQKKK